MCHEGWWRERRARRAEDAEQILRDFEAMWPADVPEVRDEPAEEVRLDTEKPEAVPAER